MIYTLGLTESYERYFREDAEPRKAVGGSVWRTEAEVEAYKRHRPSWLNDYSIYGVEADWERDTKPVEGARWHELTREAKLVKLPSGWTEFLQTLKDAAEEDEASVTGWVREVVEAQTKAYNEAITEHGGFLVPTHFADRLIWTAHLMEMPFRFVLTFVARGLWSRLKRFAVGKGRNDE